MNIKLNQNRQGFILLLLLIIIVFVVAATVIVGLYKMTKRIPANNPPPNEAEWRQLEQEAESAALAYYPEADEAHAYRRYIMPQGFGVVLRTTDANAVPEELKNLAFNMAQGKMPKLPPQYMNAPSSLTETDGTEWDLAETNGASCYFRMIPQDQIETWQMPPPDLSIPMMFFHPYFVQTNSYE